MTDQFYTTLRLHCHYNIHGGKRLSDANLKACHRAILHCIEGEYDAIIMMPNGKKVTAGEIVDAARLEFYVDNSELVPFDLDYLEDNHD